MTQGKEKGKYGVNGVKQCTEDAQPLSVNSYFAMGQSHKRWKNSGAWGSECKVCKVKRRIWHAWPIRVWSRLTGEGLEKQEAQSGANCECVQEEIGAGSKKLRWES